MNCQKIIDATGEKESEFFYRMAQHLDHKADESSDSNNHGQAYAYRKAACFLEQSANALQMESR